MLNIWIWLPYKDKLSIGMLGLVDDIIGVTEAGFKAQMLNAFINVKTAENGFSVWYQEMQKHVSW